MGSSRDCYEVDPIKGFRGDLISQEIGNKNLWQIRVSSIGSFLEGEYVLGGPPLAPRGRRIRPVLREGVSGEAVLLR